MEDETRKHEQRGLLAQLGIPPIERAQCPHAFAEIRRIAWRLRHSGHRLIGFAPADDHVGAIALAIQLALAMDQLHGVICNVLDANMARPQFTHASPVAEFPADRFGFRTFWVAERVTLSTPAGVSSLPSFASISQVALAAKQRYDYVFCDLTGLDYWGEHCAAYSLVDGVVVVARANKTLEKSILTCVDTIPLEQRLGVVLVG